MLNRELTYAMPFERLSTLSRKMSRKVYRGSWLATWVVIVAYVGVLAAFFYFSDELDRMEAESGISTWIWFALAVAATLSAFALIRRAGRRNLRARANYESPVTFRQEADGVRFATADIEYFLKWQGLSQILLEPDGIVFSHGALVFLVPNDAFLDAAERDGLLRDIYGRLSDAARERSKDFVRPVISDV